jgi:hypothetical protein
MKDQGTALSPINRRVRGREHGAGKFAGFFILFIFGCAVYIGIKVVPAYVNNYEFQDAIETEARFAIANRKQVDDIVTDVYKKVRELDLPLDKKDIHVHYPAPEAGVASVVEIDVQYTVNVEFPGYTLQLSFHPHADNHSI